MLKTQASTFDTGCIEDFDDRDRGSFTVDCSNILPAFMAQAEHARRSAATIALPSAQT